jgi:Transposase DDE domain.
MISVDKITEIFCMVDDFCKEFEKAKSGHVLTKNGGIKKRNRSFNLSDSEVITILIFFHACQFRNIKHYYMHYVQVHLRKEFPKTVSYNRFVELQRKAAMPLAVFLKTCCLGKCTGISFIDSTPLRVCHIRREKSNKVFKDMATKGQCSIGWFFGFKLHIIINDKGEILDFMLTQGNVDDREPLKNKSFHKKVFGKLVGDKGYISQTLFEQLFIDGIHLITKIRKNMKNSLMHIKDKILLKKRALIETVNDELKNICQIEHTRHRSFDNFITNMLTGLIAYSFFPKKPSLNIEIIDKESIRQAA